MDHEKIYQELLEDLQNQKKTFTLFLIFQLKPKYFYLYVNFLDIVFYSFNIDPDKLKYQTYPLTNMLIKIINGVNQLLLIIGVLTFIIYIFWLTYQSIFHKCYAVARIVICFCRFCLFFMLSVQYFLILVNY